MPKVRRFFNEQISGPGFLREGNLKVEDEDGIVFDIEIVGGRLVLVRDKGTEKE